MSQRINRVSPGSAGKIFGAMYFVLGVLFIPFLALPAMFSGGDGAGFSLALALIIPIAYGILGFVSMAGFAWFYNVLAARIGGIEVEITTVVEASSGPGM